MSSGEAAMIFGAQYYRPPFPDRGCWERDMANMRELGFNTVKFWAVWNWVEPKRGQYDFRDLDLLVDLAGRHGLQVVLNTIPEGAPAWALAGNEDSLYVTARGERIAWGGPANIPTGGWPGLCADKPSSAALVSGFIERVAAHFSGNGSVFSIDVWNEPHLEPMFDYRGELLCYCEHSRRAFREWLEANYGTVEGLNRAWFRRYEDFDEVAPSPRFGTWTDMKDWRLFWIANLRQWLRARVEAARRGAPRMRVQTHVAYSATLGNRLNGGLANELGDEFSLAPEVDLFGLSSFPKWLQGKNHFYVHLAHNEIVAEAARGKPFYQVELQGGAGKAGLLGGEVPDEHDITIWNFNTIAAGGKGVLYWQYAPEPAGLESPGFGLTGFSGQNTPRSLAAGRCAQLFSGAGLDTAERVLPSNAIYLSRKSEVLCFCADRREDLYAASVDGVYKAAYASLVPVRFVHDDYVDRLAAEGVASLYLPMPLVLSQREESALTAYVEGGGTLVSEAGVGLYTENGVLDPSCGILKRVFGVEHVELQGVPDWGLVGARFLGKGSGFAGKQYRQVVEPRFGTEVMARFEDGAPAVTERRLGRGRVVFIATFAGLGFHENEDDGTRDAIVAGFAKGGYPQVKDIRVKGPIGRGTLRPVVRLLETSAEYIIVIVNHRPENVQVEIDLAEDLGLPAVLELTVEGSSGLVQRILKNRQALARA